jgi:glycerate kinase
MRQVVAAPDKFRGSASARQVAEAAARGAELVGYRAEQAPMSDGGEGLLEAVGGTPQRSEVSGPLGTQTVTAAWSLLDGEPRTAVIETAQAAGLSLAGGPEANDPMAATTVGVGQLVMEAVRAGARRIVVGCGGSATTDGGAGALAVIADPAALRGAELLVACDVTTPFEEAGVHFGPQKGADDREVERLTERLGCLADDYSQRFGVDVRGVAGAGAAGGLAGGLFALGGRLVPGFTLVASLNGLVPKLEAADVVMTGEGCLDASSFEGKVVGGITALAPAGRPVLCVVGDAQVGFPPSDELGRKVVLKALVPLVGRARAHAEVLDLVTRIVAEELAALPVIEA